MGVPTEAEPCAPLSVPMEVVGAIRVGVGVRRGGAGVFATVVGGQGTGRGMMQRVKPRPVHWRPVPARLRRVSRRGRPMMGVAGPGDASLAAAAPER